MRGFFCFMKSNSDSCEPGLVLLVFSFDDIEKDLLQFFCILPRLPKPIFSAVQFPVGVISAAVPVKNARRQYRPRPCKNVFLLKGFWGLSQSVWCCLLLFPRVWNEEGSDDIVSTMKIFSPLPSETNPSVSSKRASSNPPGYCFFFSYLRVDVISADFGHGHGWFYMVSGEGWDLYSYGLFKTFVAQVGPPRATLLSIRSPDCPWGTGPWHHNRYRRGTYIAFLESVNLDGLDYAGLYFRALKKGFQSWIWLLMRKSLSTCSSSRKIAEPFSVL